MTKVHNWNTAWLLSWFSLSLTINKYIQRILFWIIVNDPELQILQRKGSPFFKCVVSIRAFSVRDPDGLGPFFLRPKGLYLVLGGQNAC